VTRGSRRAFERQVESNTAGTWLRCDVVTEAPVGPSEGWLFEPAIGLVSTTTYGHQVVLLFSTVTDIGVLAALDRSG
jgi:hypothetical protein